VAFNGSEPVRADTLQRFCHHFKPAGFKESAFHPCYGLAEATLMVAGDKPETALPEVIYIDKDGQIKEQYDPAYQAVVSAGAVVPGMQVVILHPGDGSICEGSASGEICIGGASVTQGYWNKDNRSFFREWNNQLLLKTGDIGFLYKDMLFVNGRIKDLLIIRGKNIYPYDIEQLIAAEINAVERNGVAAFGIMEEEEKCVVVAEIKRTHLGQLNISTTIDAIDKVIIEALGIIPYDILLLTPMGIPRTTSGKLQRVKCRELYRTNAFTAIGSKSGLQENITGNDSLLRHVKENGNTDNIKAYLLDLIAVKAGRLNTDIPAADTELTEIGIDSIRAMELINTINRDLELNLDVTKVFQHNTLSGLISSIENILWLKNIHTSGEEIII
jgi:acyl-CoA synthetase (AMP-forming)/AMP-acid ligase II/acyl carrier protein